MSEGRNARRWWIGGTIVAAVVVGGVLIARSNAGSSKSTASPTAHVTNVKVEQRDLILTDSESGTLGYGAAIKVTIPSSASTTASSSTSSSSSASVGGAGGGAATGAASASSSSSNVITALPAVGTTVDRGQSLLEVNGSPTGFLMFGGRPMWRTMQVGDTGEDVRQLEQNLSALGYGRYLAVDDSYTSGTASAVKAWQKTLGISQTGTIAPGQIWFGPGAVRVDSLSAAVGDAVGGTVMSVTGTQRQVSVSLALSKSALAVQGSKVNVTLPSGTVVPGTVTNVTTTTSTSGGPSGSQSTTTAISVTITLDQATDAAVGSPVTVAFTQSAAKGAIAVPVKALVALSEGGYAVEKVQADGSTKLVGVKIGTFADGWVQVTGDVAAGDTVRSA